MEVKLKINANCQLVASPISTPNMDDILNPCMYDSESTVFVEFLVNPNIKSNDSVKVSLEPDHYVYDLDLDGLYVYYKLEVFAKNNVDADYKGLCYDVDTQTLFFQNQELKDIVDILPYIDYADYGVLDYIKEPVFSICKLQYCLKSLVKDSLDQCSSNLCEDSSESRKTRDFLFITICVLENLIAQERFGEAMDILESITTCIPLCKKVKMTKSGCNCK